MNTQRMTPDARSSIISNGNSSGVASPVEAPVPDVEAVDPEDPEDLEEVPVLDADVLLEEAL